jgi:hypothetical protein
VAHLEQQVADLNQKMSEMKRFEDTPGNSQKEQGSGSSSRLLDSPNAEQVDHLGDQNENSGSSSVVMAGFVSDRISGNGSGGNISCSGSGSSRSNVAVGYSHGEVSASAPPKAAGSVWSYFVG